MIKPPYRRSYKMPLFLSKESCVKPDNHISNHSECLTGYVCILNTGESCGSQQRFMASGLDRGTRFVQGHVLVGAPVDGRLKVTLQGGVTRVR